MGTASTLLSKISLLACDMNVPRCLTTVSLNDLFATYMYMYIRWHSAIYNMYMYICNLYIYIC